MRIHFTLDDERWGVIPYNKLELVRASVGTLRASLGKLYELPHFRSYLICSYAMQCRRRTHMSTCYLPSTSKNGSREPPLSSSNFHRLSDAVSGGLVFMEFGVRNSRASVRSIVSSASDL
jgi:hypothetical protein